MIRYMQLVCILLSGVLEHDWSHMAHISITIKTEIAIGMLVTLLETIMKGPKITNGKILKVIGSTYRYIRRLSR